MGVWIETVIKADKLNLLESHPSWVCGLKPHRNMFTAKVGEVTPFVGVWIETVDYVDNFVQMIVTPFVGVWIETFWAMPKGSRRRVTPFVGVWIETSFYLCCKPSFFVTPFVGVWIET